MPMLTLTGFVHCVVFNHHEQEVSARRPVSVIPTIQQKGVLGRYRKQQRYCQQTLRVRDQEFYFEDGSVILLARAHKSKEGLTSIQS
ncbi:hypothetical protein RhiJN_25366 [Ceratobasidium sp. AG-Ba]|nr:hypothetical protein RhiJN_25366 [Ceratobasidium sp. AG-Ba]